MKIFLLVDGKPSVVDVESQLESNVLVSSIRQAYKDGFVGNMTFEYNELPVHRVAFLAGLRDAREYRESDVITLYGGEDVTGYFWQTAWSHKGEVCDVCQKKVGKGEKFFFPHGPGGPGEMDKLPVQVACKNCVIIRRKKYEIVEVFAGTPCSGEDENEYKDKWSWVD